MEDNELTLSMLDAQYKNAWVFLNDSLKDVIPDKVQRGEIIGKYLENVAFTSTFVRNNVKYPETLKPSELIKLLEREGVDLIYDIKEMNEKPISQVCVGDFNAYRSVSLSKNICYLAYSDIAEKYGSKVRESFVEDITGKLAEEEKPRLITKEKVGDEWKKIGEVDCHYKSEGEDILVICEDTVEDVLSVDNYDLSSFYEGVIENTVKNLPMKFNEFFSGKEKEVVEEELNKEIEERLKGYYPSNEVEFGVIPLEKEGHVVTSERGARREVKIDGKAYEDLLLYGGD